MSRRKQATTRGQSSDNMAFSWLAPLPSSSSALFNQLTSVQLLLEEESFDDTAAEEDVLLSCKWLLSATITLGETDLAPGLPAFLFEGLPPPLPTVSRLCVSPLAGEVVFVTCLTDSEHKKQMVQAARKNRIPELSNEVDTLQQYETAIPEEVSFLVQFHCRYVYARGSHLRAAGRSQCVCLPQECLSPLAGLFTFRAK